MVVLLVCQLATGLDDATSPPAKNPAVVKREKAAQVLLQKKAYKEVVRMLNAYTDIATLDGLLTLAGAYHELEMYPEEIKVLNLVSARHPQQTSVNFLLGHAHYQHSKKLDPIRRVEEESKAIQEFRRSISLNKKFKPSYDALLEVFIANNSRHDARGVIHDMLTLFGQRPELINDLCRLYSLDGFGEQALESCQEAIRLSPKFTNNYIFLARLLNDQGETEKAGRILSQTAGRFPASDFVQSAAGEYYLSKKDYPVAARYYKKAVELKTTDTAAHRGLAKALTEMSEWESALPHFVQSCQADPLGLRAFQEATAKLRLNGDKKMEEKYNRALLNCKR